MTERQRWLRETRSYTVARLAAALAEDGYRVAVDEDRGGLVVSGLHEEVFDPPVRIAETDAELRRSLLAMPADAAYLWPDVSPVEAAYRLFHVHLDEDIASATARDLPDLPPLPPGEFYEYLSQEQYRERYGDDTADVQPDAR